MLSLTKNRVYLTTIVVLLVVPIWSIESQCSVDGMTRDSKLQLMKYDVGDGEETFWAYVAPAVSSFYVHQDPPSSKPVVMKHKGLGAKFINLGNKPISIYWERELSDFERGKAMIMRQIPPFSAKGTSAFPGHSFVFALEDGTFLKRVIVDPSHGNLHSFDPYLVHDPQEASDGNVNLEQLELELSDEEQAQYWRWRKTLRFDSYYRAFTGRSYYATFPRQPPMHFMWPAQYFGQEHWVTTLETHFIKPPPHDVAFKVVELQKRVESEPISLEEYRSEEPVLNMTLTVASCEPRVFVIENFLSMVEVQHILEIAQQMNLAQSTLGDEKNAISQVRTSRNTWVNRAQSPVIDAVYRRAADLMRIDEALMRHRSEGEELNIPSERPQRNTSIGEELQLVHYTKGQEYQAHHDFAFAPLADTADSARFATLLLYLNEDMKGGETSFPKFHNAHTFEALKIKPETGKAVLFYSQLPDGNMDELSQHKAHAIRENTKWLINLWVWDPIKGI